jgi:hypothetical protein
MSRIKPVLPNPPLKLADKIILSKAMKVLEGDEVRQAIRSIKRLAYDEEGVKEVAKKRTDLTIIRNEITEIIGLTYDDSDDRLSPEEYLGECLYSVVDEAIEQKIPKDELLHDIADFYDTISEGQEPDTDNAA